MKKMIWLFDLELYCICYILAKPDVSIKVKECVEIEIVSYCCQCHQIGWPYVGKLAVAYQCLAVIFAVQYRDVIVYRDIIISLMVQVRT